MRAHPSFAISFLLVTLGGGAIAAACGGSSDGDKPNNVEESPDTGVVQEQPDTEFDVDFNLDGSMEDAADVFEITPTTLQTITVTAGTTTPKVTYSATLNGKPAKAAWSLDRGELGSISSTSATSIDFTPSGKQGGLATISANLNGTTVKRQVFVKLASEQNGVDPTNTATKPQVPATVAALTAGGGVGGVGGEGLGVAVTDAATKTALAAPTDDGSAQKLKMLYPYDGTVFPRGLVAPLLMWDWTTGDADAVQIELATTSGSFSWTGTFGRPAILTTTGGKFVRHPIPQDVWQRATDTAGGTTPDGSVDKLTVKVTVAKGGVAHGPMTRTWTIAPGRLSGTIYYNSYGTQLVKNYPGSIGGDGQFGAAVLSIRPGDTAPKVAAGKAGSGGCRVCHSVAANGSRLVVGREAGQNSAYDLSPTGSTETPLTLAGDFPGLSPTGDRLMLPTGAVHSLPAGTALPSSGLVATNLGPAAFSPDGKRVAFNPITSSTITNPTQKLVAMDYDPTTGVFSGALTVVDLTGQPATTRPGWPAFLPDGKSLVFHSQSAPGLDGNGLADLRTRKGAKAQIVWAGIGSTPSTIALDALNGKDSTGASYLPKLAAPMTLACTADGAAVGGLDADHADDVNLNYEPTVNPLPAGGYVWVIFTSRRLYGNEATIPPFCSDPRGVNLLTNITTKKLWVAAIDLSAPAGKDASHPAFYLPAQELLAGNARGFWSLDPCRSDGSTCDTGDQCCGGYCTTPPSGSGLICDNKPPMGSCSRLGDKCTTAADCCDSSTNVCINGYCALPGPK